MSVSLLRGTVGAVYLRIFAESYTDVALSSLVLAVADAEVVANFGKLVEFCQEFID